MNDDINLTNFIFNLKQASGKPISPKDISNWLQNESSGVTYLYHNVLLPLLEGKKVSSDELEMENFSMDDIDTLIGYYSKYERIHSNERTYFKDIFKLLHSQPPALSFTTFL